MLRSDDMLSDAQMINAVSQLPQTDEAFSAQEELFHMHHAASQVMMSYAANFTFTTDNPGG